MQKITITRQSGEVDINLDKNSNLDLSFVWKAGIKDAELPIDLTGCTCNFQVKELLENKTVGDVVVEELTTENGGITVDGINGNITLHFKDESTELYNWTYGYHRLNVLFPSGETRRLFRGLITAYSEHSRL
jgi:hypothetical protein